MVLPQWNCGKMGRWGLSTKTSRLASGDSTEALRYHWCPIALIVMAGSTNTPSIEYNRANDGIAMNKRMTLGNMVQIISIVVPWTILCGIGLVCLLKCHKARTNIRDTKTKIRMRKKKISWCKMIMGTHCFEDHNFLHCACSDFRIRQLSLLKDQLQEHNAFCGFLLGREATLPGRPCHPEKISFLCWFLSMKFAKNSGEKW